MAGRSANNCVPMYWLGVWKSSRWPFSERFAPDSVKRPVPSGNSAWRSFARSPALVLPIGSSNGQRRRAPRSWRRQWPSGKSRHGRKIRVSDGGRAQPAGTKNRHEERRLGEVGIQRVWLVRPAETRVQRDAELVRQVSLTNRR